jgi:hypothetical protein
MFILVYQRNTLSANFFLTATMINKANGAD